MNAVNAHLAPLPITILEATLAGADFHARFSAQGRRYLYRVLNRPAPPALESGRVWHVKAPLDIKAMDAAARHLVGRHDFTTFRAAECQAKSPVKTLDRLDVARYGDELRVRASARSFLQHQMRSIAGSLIHVGEGKWSADDLAAALHLPVSRVEAALDVLAAPGIAEALFATAIGLIAAIPATIFYNKFTSEVNRQAQRLEGFADEFSAILSRQIDERA